MKTTRIVLFLIVLSILWCADVFAHMGNCKNADGLRYGHFEPHTADKDPLYNPDNLSRT